METDQLGRLRDILEAARLNGAYLKDTTKADFHAPAKKFNKGVIREGLGNPW